jgi:hypothetical protein
MYLELMEAHSQFKWVNTAFEDIVISFLIDTMRDNPKSIFHLISDHGLHYTEFASSEWGKIDHKLPFWITLVPNFKLKDRLCKDTILNMNENSLKRISWYDFHASMLDLESWECIPGKTSSFRANKFGMSIYKSVLPDERDCRSMGLHYQFCSIYSMVNCKETPDFVENQTILALEWINSRLEQYKNICLHVTTDIFEEIEVTCYTQSLVETKFQIVFRGEMLLYQATLIKGKVVSVTPISRVGKFTDPCKSMVASSDSVLCLCMV